jgi:hypothetical protein
MPIVAISLSYTGRGQHAVTTRTLKTRTLKLVKTARMARMARQINLIDKVVLSMDRK